MHCFACNEKNIEDESENLREHDSFLSNAKWKREKAFTLAEVLITLGIIGVVAAMTLPALIQNYQKHVTVTRLKSTYSMLKQAIRLSEAENGEMSEWSEWESMASQGASASGNGTSVTKSLVQKYLEPYLKVVHSDTLASSSMPYEYDYYTMDGTLVSAGGHTHYSIALNNGVYLHFNASWGASSSVGIRIDINGKQKPNIVGIDTFYVNFYPDGGKFNGEGTRTRERLLSNCSNRTLDGGQYCGALIQADGWEIKDDYPWK